MRSSVLFTAALLLFGAALVSADQSKPDLSGTWKLDQARSEAGRADKDMTLIIQEQGPKIHIEETRGSNPKDDVSSFTCGTMGNQCPMEDGRDKAEVTVYYNGPVLIVLKTHGRRGSTVEKQRLALSAKGDALMVEVIPIVPEGKAEKLVFSKAQ